MDGQVVWNVINTANTSSGLPSDEVISLRFSSDNKLWVSTNLALANFDGKKWRVIEKKDGLTWENARLGKVFIDSKDNIWICSDENGLAKISPDMNILMFEHTEGDENGIQSNTVYDVVEDNDGGYFISNWSQFNKILSHLDKDGNWKHYEYSALSNNPFDKALCLAFDKVNNRLYAGTLFEGVKYLDGDKFIPVSSDYQTAVSDITIGNDGKLYAATDLGVMVLDTKALTIEKFMTKEVDGLADNFTQSVAIDPLGNIWAGTDGEGLSIIDKDGNIKIMNTETGLSSNDIYSITFDEQGKAFLGTRIGGICYQAEDGSWKHIGSTGIAGNTVIDIAFNGEEAFYATSAGLSYFNGKLWKNFTPQSIEQSGFASNYIKKAFYDNRSEEKKNIFISGNGSVGKYNLVEKTWEFYPYSYTNKKEEIKYPSFSLMQTKNGDLWVTTFGHNLGFAKLNEETKEYIFYNDSNTDAIKPNCNSFFNAVEAPDNSIWFCSVAGAVILKNGQFHLEEFETTVEVTNPDTGETQEGKDNNVRNVTFDSNGKAWISKLSGIYIYDLKTGEKKQELGPKNDPLSIVTKILIDKDGNAFIGTLLDGLYLRLQSGRYIHLTEKYGLSEKLQITEMYFHNEALYLCTDEGVMFTKDFDHIVKQAESNQLVVNDSDKFHIYPNPAQEYITFPQHTIKYAIFDANGQMIKSGDSDHMVSINFLPKGIYFVKYLIHGNWLTEKVIVK